MIFHLLQMFTLYYWIEYINTHNALLMEVSLMNKLNEDNEGISTIEEWENENGQ